MEEDDGQEAAQDERGECEGDSYHLERVLSIITIFNKYEPMVKPGQPGHITNCTDSNVDPRRPLAKPDSGLTTTATDIEPGEGEEGEDWEEEDGRVAGDDLEGALTSQVQAAEDGQEGLGKEEDGYGEGEVRRCAILLIIIK